MLLSGDGVCFPPSDFCCSMLLQPSSKRALMLPPHTHTFEQVELTNNSSVNRLGHRDSDRHSHTHSQRLCGGIGSVCLMCAGLCLMILSLPDSIWRGPNVNCVDSTGYTPLHHAALNGHRYITSLCWSFCLRSAFKRGQPSLTNVPLGRHNY